MKEEEKKVKVWEVEWVEEKKLVEEVEEENKLEEKVEEE